jgi:hypothetical protein
LAALRLGLVPIPMLVRVRPPMAVLVSTTVLASLPVLTPIGTWTTDGTWKTYRLSSSRMMWVSPRVRDSR